jgi:hypothetical protein
MSYVYSGDSRSLSVTITKYINGVPQVPLTFPTSNDIANGYFTYTGGDVNIPTAQQLAQMTPAEYSSAYEALRLYVQESVPGFLWASLPPGAILVPNIIEDDPNCPPTGTPVATTTTTAAATTTTTAPPTTTTTTSGETTTTTTEEQGTCYGLWIPTASLTSGEEVLYVTYRNPSGVLVDSWVGDLEDTGEWNDGVVINLCSVPEPIFKYGSAGQYVSAGSIGIDVFEGGECSENNECVSPASTPLTAILSVGEVDVCTNPSTQIYIPTGCNSMSLTGCILYLDPALENVVTGYSFVRVNGTDVYHTLNDITGEVGEPTGYCGT